MEAAEEFIVNVQNLDVAYGKLWALRGVDLTASLGEVVAIVGSNGAGKTTLLNAISGFVPIGSGGIRVMGTEVGSTPRAEYKMARMGVIQVSQNRDLFGKLTVVDNLRLGSLVRAKNNYFKNIERVFECFPRLRERATQRAETMSGGEQQMLAIARAMMAEPRVLLLDEPSAGLAPLFVERVVEVIRNMSSEDGVSVLLVEQNIAMAAKVAGRFYVLRQGDMAAHGEGSELAGNSTEIIRKYFL